MILMDKVFTVWVVILNLGDSFTLKSTIEKLNFVTPLRSLMNYDSYDFILEERDAVSAALLSSTVVSNSSSSTLLVDNFSEKPSGNMFTSRASKYIKSLIPLFKALFLPAGYPLLVPNEYMRYQKWNLVQDACSYLRGVMSTQAILTGMGVGRTDITTLEATVQWILRDGASMVGGLLFTTLSSANFGQNVKSWRIFADFINNLGITLDMIAPMFGKSFVTIVCVASVCKALCGVAAGATNAVIAEHWGAKNGNMADVLAKNGAQHTLVNLLGLSISVQFARFANVSSTRMWFVYTILTILHMYANIQAMRILALRSLNVARYDILVDTFINSDVFGNVIDHAVNSTSINSNDKIIVSDVLKSDLQSWMSTKNLLTPESVAKREPIISLIVPKPISILARKFYDFRIMVTSFQLKRLLEKRNKNNDDIQNCSPILSDKIYELQQILYTLLRMKPFKGQEVSKFGDVSIWVPPSTIVSKFSSQEISSSLSKYHNLDYFMIPSDDIGTKKHSTISVCCKSGCSNRQQAQAVFEAKVYLKCNDLTTASVLTSMIFPLFWEYLVNNWEVNRILLQPRFPRAYTAILTK